MTFTQVGTATGNDKTSGQASLAITTTTAGNLFLLAVVNSSSATTTCTGVSAGGITTWGQVSTAQTNSSVGTQAMFWGVVTTPGTANVAATYSASIGTNTVYWSYIEFSAGVAGTWSLDIGGKNTTSSGSPMSWPTLTPAGSNELYVGKEYDSATGAFTGTTVGCTYVVDTVTGYDWVYDPATSAVLTPQATLSGGTLATISHGALFKFTSSTAANSNFFSVF